MPPERTPPRAARVVRGTVTPSRASRFFLPRASPVRPPHTPVRDVPVLQSSTPYEASPSWTPASDAGAGRHVRAVTPEMSSEDDWPSSPTAVRHASPVRARPRGRPPTDALAVRQGSSMSRRARAPAVSLRRYLSSFDTPPDAYYHLPSGAVPHGTASPLSAAYMHGACAAPDVPQYLAVGDDEGRVHVLDTLQPPRDASALALQVSTAPLVAGSVFSMAWRDDDRVLALGASDYSVSVWDVQHEVCVASHATHHGSARALAWDPTSRGTLVVSGGRDGALVWWDLRSDVPAMHVPRAHARLRARGRRGARPAAAVTALAYLADGYLASAVSEDACVQTWDARMLGVALGTSVDVSLTTPWNTRPHGLSSLVYAPSRGHVWAACTDGCIYALDTRDPARLAPGGPVRALFHESQRHNTLYARMALCQDRLLALGCNSGDVVLWDTWDTAADAGVARHGVVLPRRHEDEYVERANAVPKSMRWHGAAGRAAWR